MLPAVSSKDVFLDHFCFDLPNASRLLDPIMFVDHTNLFFDHKDIKHLFTVVNKELVNIKDKFTAKKLSLNAEKSKYPFFHKPSKKDNIPLCLSKLIITNYKIQREASIKFLGVLLDQQLIWKEHIKLTDNKIAKKYKARPFSDKRAFICLYYSYIYVVYNTWFEIEEYYFEYRRKTYRKPCNL